MMMYSPPAPAIPSTLDPKWTPLDVGADARRTAAALSDTLVEIYGVPSGAAGDGRGVTGVLLTEPSADLGVPVEFRAAERRSSATSAATLEGAAAFGLPLSTAGGPAWATVAAWAVKAYPPLGGGGGAVAAATPPRPARLDVHLDFLADGATPELVAQTAAVLFGEDAPAAAGVIAFLTSKTGAASVRRLAALVGVLLPEFDP